MNETPQRIWRLRKLSHAVDAEIETTPLGECTLRFLYDGAVTYRRTWPDRQQALGEAAQKRTELEQSGWMAHW